MTTQVESIYGTRGLMDVLALLLEHQMPFANVLGGSDPLLRVLRLRIMD